MKVLYVFPLLKKSKLGARLSTSYFKCVVFSKLVPNKKNKICLANFLVTAQIKILLGKKEGNKKCLTKAISLKLRVLGKLAEAISLKL
jgi:hypothetical protein